MASQRKAIRYAVADLLVAGNTSADDRVARTKKTPWRSKELPAISVYTVSESVAVDASRSLPRVLNRNLDVTVEGTLKLTDDIDDALDDFAEEIEAVMKADPTFGGAAVDSILSDTSFSFDLNAEQPVGCVSLTYAVLYVTEEPGR